MARSRWGILLAPALLYFLSYFHRVAPVVVAGDLMAAFAVSAAALGLLSAIYPYCFAVMALPGGGLTDFLGPRRTLTLGGLGMSAGAIVFGLAPTFAVAFGGRLLVGLGASVMLIGCLRLAAEWFRTDEFATVAGASQSVGSLGALAGTTPLAVLVEQMGWRNAFVTIGATTALLSVACFLSVRGRPAGSGAIDRSHGAGPGLRDVAAGIPSVLGNPRSWTAGLISGGVYGGFAAFVGLWGVPYLTQVHGLSRVRAANLIALAAVGLLVGAPLVGWLSDRVLERRRLPLILVSGLNVLTWLPLVAPATPIAPALLAPVCFLIGLGSSVVVLVFATIREVNDPRHVGVALGFHNLPAFLSFGLTQWLTGVVLDRLWDGTLVAGARVYGADAYRAAFTLCLMLALGAFLSACWVTETRCRNIWSAN